MGKVYSLAIYRINRKGSADFSEIKSQIRLNIHLETAKTQYKKQLLKPNSKGNDCQVIHVDFKNKRKVA